MWRERERIDVWVVRFSSEAGRRFWGFGQLPLPEAKAILSKTKVLQSSDHSFLPTVVVTLNPAEVANLVS